MHLLFAIGVMLSLMATPATTTATCDYPPITLPLWNATPAAEIAPATSEMAAPELPDPHTVISGFVACINSGDPRLVWAIFTPHYIASQFTDSTVHYLPAFEQDLESTTTAATQPVEIVEVGDPEVLPDGRIRIDVTLSSDGTIYADSLTLVFTEGRWYIDDTSPISAPIATPAS